MLNKLQSLKNHQGFMKYFKNTSWLMLEKVLRIISGLFLGIWIARYLGPEQFGLLNYAISFAGLFTAFASLGLDSIVIRELVQYNNKRDKIIATAFVLKIIGAMFILSILIVIVNFISNDQYTNILILIIASATLFKSFNVIDFYFQSQVLSKYVVIVNIISITISSVLKIILLVNQASLIYFALIFLFDSMLLSMGFLYFYNNVLNFRLSIFDFRLKCAKSLLIDGLPLVLSTVVISIYMKIDQVMIQDVLGSKAVGQYAAAVKISELWYFLPMIISASLFPAIVNAKNKDKASYYEKMQKLYDLMVWIAVLIAIPITFLSDWIITLLYGNAYNQAGDVLIIHVWSGIFVFLTVSSGKFLIAENMLMKTFYRNVSAMFVNIILNLYLIERYGINGAAIATLISWIVSGYLYDLFDKDLRLIFIQKTKSLIGYRFIQKLLKKGSEK